MQLTFSEKNLNTVFEVSEDGQLQLLHFSNIPYNGGISDAAKKDYTAVEVQLTGYNQDDHHGVKHTGTYGSKTLKYVSHEYYRNEHGNKLEFTLQNCVLEAVLHYQFYDGISAARVWTVLKNISAEDAELEYVTSFSLLGVDAGEQLTSNEKLNVYLPHNSWVREVNWKKYTLSDLGFDKITGFSTKRINICNTGTWSAKEYLPMAAVENTETKTHLMWQIENNGSWQWEMSDIAGKMYLKLSGPTENENCWHKSLKPGERFESVKAAVCVGDSFDTALAEMTYYRRKIVRTNICDKNLPVIFNDYMNCLLADPTAEKMIPVIDKAAEAGAEYYCMDAGWYADGTWWETVGEWQPCGWRFPDGIKATFDYIKSKGMVPGIWLEIEVMGVDCPIADQFSDDCFFMRHGKRVIDHGRYQLDFRSQKVRDFATSVVDRIVTEYGAGYIKTDYNIEAGSGTEVASDSFGDGLLEHNRAYLAWIESIMDKYPELVIENCSSGGMRMDYAMLAVFCLQSVTDQEDFRNMAAISAAASTAALPEQAAMWAYPMAADSDNAVVFNMVNAMMLRMHLSGQIHQLSDEQMQLVKQAVECYKSIRGDITKATAFYPMGLPEYNDGWICVGYDCGEHAYMSIWRLDTEADCVEIPVSQSDALVLYAPGNGCDISLKNGKLNVRLDDKYSAVFVKLK